MLGIAESRDNRMIERTLNKLDLANLLSIEDCYEKEIWENAL